MKYHHVSLGILLLAGIALVSCAGDGPAQRPPAAAISNTTVVDLWNGNRSAIRQVYERKVLVAVLEATAEDWGPWVIEETLDEYPGDDEALVFTEKGHDLFVTIAGNQKFKAGDMIVIPEPMTKNLLGYRIPIIREQDADIFSSITQEKDLQKLRHGIPLTWSDAVIFRHNGYEVVESGELDAIFDYHYGNIVEELSLDRRVLFILDNPLIPDQFRDLKPDLDNL